MVAFCQAENRPHTAPSDRLSRNMVMVMVVVVVCWRSLIGALALLQMFLLAQSASPAGSAGLLHLWRWFTWMQIGGGQPRKLQSCLSCQVNNCLRLSVARSINPPWRSSATWATSLGRRPPCHSSHLRLSSFASSGTVRVMVYLQAAPFLNKNVI